MKKQIVVLFALGLMCCDNFTNTNQPNNEFVGNWKSNYKLVYTLEDSLYRDSLKQHLLENDIDIDRYFSDSTYGMVNKSRFDTLTEGFSYKCPITKSCKEILWIDTRTVLFTKDSVIQSKLRNGELEEKNTRAYSFDKDSLFLTDNDSKYSLGYTFNLVMDTLIIYDLNESDTLERQKL